MNLPEQGEERLHLAPRLRNGTLRAMDKDFFSELEARRKDFSDRGGVGGDIRTELVLVNGRTFLLDRVIETAEGWLQVDGHDSVDEQTPISVVLPYHQVSQVVFTKERPRQTKAGFSR
jgi:hypothetical protein